MSKRMVVTRILLIVMILSLFTPPTAAFNNQIVDYQDFLTKVQSEVDHFETQMVYSLDHYDQKIFDLKKLYDELKVRNPASEFITTLSAEYDYDKHTLAVDITYLYDSAKCMSLYNNAMKNIDRISIEIFKPGMTDYEKVKAAHDYIINHVKYDEVASRDDQYHQNENLFSTPVLEQKALCGGYAWMLKALLDRVNIGSQIIIGTFQRSDGVVDDHAWNIVWLNGKTYHVDVTNDDLEMSVPSYGYFMVKDDLISKNYTWNRSSYPICSDGSLEYYEKHKLLIGDSKTAINLLKAQMNGKYKSREASAILVFKVLYPEAFDSKWMEELVTQAAKASSPKWIDYKYEYMLKGDIRYVRVFRNK